MRELILIIAIMVAIGALVLAYRWLKRTLRLVVELQALVNTCKAYGLTDSQIAADVTRYLAARRRAPFETLRILRGAGR
ncbi:MAG: hypothetical protein QME79_14160 [Bacillota bacterium]|nr:hypothetical protein [Bacillota bacterium]